MAVPNEITAPAIDTPVVAAPIDTTPPQAAELAPDAGAVDTPAAGPAKPGVDADIAAFRAGAAKVSANPEAVAPNPTNTPAEDAPIPEGMKRDAAGRFVPKDAPATPETAATPSQPDTPKSIDVDAEVKELGLKGKTETRFREMAETIKESAPLREELAKAGITKVEQLPDLIGRADRAEQWERAVQSTGATPEQFGATMTYTTLAVRANAGDIEAAKAAYQVTLTEQAHWAKMLGMEAPGVDPLAENSDLREEVESGDLTRARALEIAQSRAQSKAVSSRDQSAREADTSTQAHQQAITDLGALDARLKATDPHYAQKLPMMAAALQTIRENVHPSKWNDAVQRAWAALPTPVAPAPAPVQRAPITAMPVRPTGTSAGMQRVPQNDVEAFKLGVASVR